MALSTSIVPRSGCAMISAAGIATNTSAATTSRSRSWRSPLRCSVFSASSSARPVTTPSLANSAGWIDMPPIRIHERDPLMTAPNGDSTSARPTMAAR